MVMAIARRPKRAKRASLRSLLPPYVVHGGVMCDGCSKVYESTSPERGGSKDVSFVSFEWCCTRFLAILFLQTLLTLSFIFFPCRWTSCMDSTSCRPRRPPPRLTPIAALICASCVGSATCRACCCCRNYRRCILNAFRTRLHDFCTFQFLTVFCHCSLTYASPRMFHRCACFAAATRGRAFRWIQP
jgi:hypothetical protein